MHYKTERPTIAEIISLLLVMGLALWMYRRAFQCFFVQDDFTWLQLSRFHTFGEWANCFFRFNPAGTYRPLSQETFFAVAQRIFGLWPAGFHIFNMASHLIAVLLLYKLLRQFSGALAAIIGSLFYAVHSVHLMAIYWISAFPEPLAMIFFLTAVLLFVRFDRRHDRLAYYFSLIAMLFGIMSKESILTLPLILSIYCLIWTRSRLLWTLPYWGLSGAYITLRIISSAVELAPYDLTLGRQTADTIAAYLAWMAGFSANVVAKLGWSVPKSYYWIAIGFAFILLLLLLLSRNKQASIFALFWIAFALQPILYFSDHSVPYYLAPATAGFSIFLATALSPLKDFTGWKGWLLLPAATGVLWLFYLGIKPEGDWWSRRTLARKELVEKLLDINKRVPEGGTAYIAGLKHEELENFESGAILNTFHLQPTRFRFLLPELDPDLPASLDRLARSDAVKRAYCFVLSEGTITDRTTAFRADPLSFSPQAPIVFHDVPGVKLDISPPIAHRGTDTLIIKTINLEARIIDVLYSLNGQLMPPLLNWHLDTQHSAVMSIGPATPVGAYRFIAIRPSDTADGMWIKIDAHTQVR
jgi:hypothetical protein